MCINLIKVPINSKKIYVENNPRLINYVPCGKCFECRQQKTNDLMVRAYYNECDYALFDTLTYSDDNLNWYHDIAVLNYEDYQKFMKRLRINLERNGIDTKNNIKYIVAGEYGTRFTKRPHIHLIMFVKNNAIDAEELSCAIDSNWRKGITDGIKYKGKTYFWNNRVFSKWLQKTNTIGYICKYMTKTGEYQSEVERKLFYDTWLRMDQENLKMSNYELTKYINKIIRPYCQFVRWSKGFGKEFVEIENELKKYESKGYIQIKTDLKNKKYSLPLYYRRKLYTIKIGDEIRLNDNGIIQKQKELVRQKEYNKEKLIIYGIKNNVEDIAEYMTYYKDRIIYNELAGHKKIEYNGKVILNENSNRDRMLYENGKTSENMSTKQFIKENIYCDNEYDVIIENMNKKLNEQNKKVAEINEKIKHNKKIIQKFD